jgi:hypothetical protein
LLAIFLVISCSGCLTFGKGMIDTNESVAVESSPQGAQVEAGKQDCETPCVVELEQTRDHVLVVKKAGYEPRILNIRSKHGWGGAGLSFVTNSAVWGWWTLGIGTVAGMLVDLVSGSMKSLELPEDKIVKVELDEEKVIPHVSGAPPGS